MMCRSWWASPTERDEAETGGNSSVANLARVVTTTASAEFPGYKLQREYWAELNWDIGPALITYQPTFRTWYQNDHRFLTPSFIGSGLPLEQSILSPLTNFRPKNCALPPRITLRSSGWWCFLLP